MILPPIRSSELAETHAVYLLDITPELPWFRGHFPGHPVLPGLVQVEWARLLCERDLKPWGGFQGLRSVKFQRLVKPGMTLCLRLALKEDRVDWRLSVDEDNGPLCSSGLILFGAP